MTSSDRFVEIYKDKVELSRASASKILDIANQTIASRGSFAIALSGGSTPKLLYSLLASNDFNSKTDWSKWHIFIGDERLVPFENLDSNFGMAKETLLDHVAIPLSNIHSINTSLGELSAEDYEMTLNIEYQKLGISGLDIILLGLGSDGHTLSLFPGKPAVNEMSKLVALTDYGVLPPFVNRVTFTRAAVETAKLALFLVSGQDKAAVTSRILSGSLQYDLPASLIVPSSTLSVCWMLDQAAASKL